MKIVLYDEGRADELDIDEVARYLARKIEKVKVEVRGSPFAGNLNQEQVSDIAREIAATKIESIKQKMLQEPEPMTGEVEYEKRRILGKTRSFGVIYDGFRLLRILTGVIPDPELNPEYVHIIFTNRLFATWDDNDRRYHLRTSIYGFPSVISTTGIIEAPAKPRDYYLLKQQYESLRKDLTELKDSFRGRFIDYGDERLTEVVKGYVMQAVFYALTGSPFCEDKGCRSYNAHWQEELIFAQLESGYEFCPRHARLLGGAPAAAN